MTAEAGLRSWGYPEPPDVSGQNLIIIFVPDKRKEPILRPTTLTRAGLRRRAVLTSVQGWPILDLCLKRPPCNCVKPEAVFRSEGSVLLQ